MTLLVMVSIFVDPSHADGWHEVSLTFIEISIVLVLYHFMGARSILFFSFAAFASNALMHAVIVIVAKFI